VFAYCDNLRTINGKDYYVSGDEFIWLSASWKGDYTIPSGITSIGGHAFCNCENMTGISIPDGVKTIGTSAFHGCSSLREVSIPDGVRLLSHFVFSDCSNLSKVSLPESVTFIGADIFNDCDSLSSIIVTKGTYAEQCLKGDGYTDILVIK